MTAQFATTHWNQVLAAVDSSAPDARDALELLCGAYWYPLYAYVHRQGADAADAADMTQAFFAYLLEKNLLKSADPEKGRFRSFLLSCMKNFLSHERERAGALKRGGGADTLSLDASEAESRFSLESDDALPDALFEQRWALTLMERAMKALELESKAGPNPARWPRLKPMLTGKDDTRTYKDIGNELGMTDAAVRVAVHRLRKRYGELLRREIAVTVANPADNDDELRHLLGVVDGKTPGA